MMNNKIHIKPCHENWDIMTPVEQGRFCAACKRTVVNLEHATPDEIHNIIAAQNYNLCARIPAYMANPMTWWLSLKMFFLNIAGMLFFLFPGHKASAQIQIQKDDFIPADPDDILPQIATNLLIAPEPKCVTISGRLNQINSSELIPVPYTWVTITVGTQQWKTQSNHHGCYSMDLEVSFITDSVAATISVDNNDLMATHKIVLLKRSSSNVVTNLELLNYPTYIPHRSAYFIGAVSSYSYIERIQAIWKPLLKPGGNQIPDPDAQRFRYYEMKNQPPLRNELFNE